MIQKSFSSKQFQNEKQQCLSRIDRSIKGSIDKPIELLVDKINSSENFYTTSSCSGRIVVVCNNDNDDNLNNPNGDNNNSKKNIRWQFISHSIIENEQENFIKPFLEYSRNNNDDLTQMATLKFESFILHIRCLDLESARKLLQCAIDSGQRNSGLMLSNNGHLTVAIRNTLNLEVPLIIKKRLMVSEDYLNELIKIVNDKMENNLKMIERFLKNCQIKNIF